MIVLAHRPDADAERRLVEEDPDQDHADERHVGQDGLVGEEDLADDGDLGEHRDGDPRQAPGAHDGLGVALGPGEQVQKQHRAALAQGVHGDAAEDDVRLELEGEEADHEGQEHAQHHGAQDAHEGAAALPGAGDRDEGAQGHGALEADVDHARLLRDRSGQGREQDRHHDADDGGRKGGGEDGGQDVRHELPLLSWLRRLFRPAPSGSPGPPASA